MKTMFGAQQMTKPAGMLAPVRIDNLVRLDEMTGDGRLLKSSGANVRELPRTIYGGFEEGDPHGPNLPIGRLDAVEFDPDSNTATGWGWLLDDEAGQKAAQYISSGVLRHNSIHMAEIEMNIDWASDDPSDPGFWEPIFTFEKWSVASTTLLGIPAFKDSTFVMEEVTAAMEDGTLVLDAERVTIEVQLMDTEVEVTADGSPKPSWEYFFTPEDPEGQPLTVGERDENGFYPVWGHIAQWGTCHDGILGRCVIAPRPKDGYAGFNAGKVLTDKGFVHTGPIFFEGGHPDKPLGEGDVWKAYGGVENAWADVRVTEGVYGPWASGYVRPSVTDDVVIVARASGVSGHWATDGRLKAIVSVNSRGYDTPSRATGKVITDAEGHVLEVVAGFLGCPDEQTNDSVTITASNLTLSPQVSGSTTYGHILTFDTVPAPVEINVSAPVQDIMRELRKELGLPEPLDEDAEAALALLALEDEDEDAV